jgi:hypothetical protein
LSKTIAINGVRLDDVRMPLVPYSKDVVSSLCYPMSQIGFSRDDDTICLVLPAYLSVELSGCEYSRRDFDQRPLGGSVRRE